jgi:hypothetical protein
MCAGICSHSKATRKFFALSFSFIQATSAFIRRGNEEKSLICSNEIFIWIVDVYANEWTKGRDRSFYIEINSMPKICSWFKFFKRTKKIRFYLQTKIKIVNKVVIHLATTQPHTFSREEKNPYHYLYFFFLSLENILFLSQEIHLCNA